MAKIAFLLLCHKDPKAIIKQAKQFTDTGDYIAIHFDARAPKAAFKQIKSALKDNPNVAFAKKRYKCGWGAWSLVAATLSVVETAARAFPDASHFYMVSGDCMPIKSAPYTRDFLDQNDVDYIESFDYFKSGWIKTGFVEERLIYRHFFNERTQKRLFYTSFRLQKRLGITRDVPKGVRMMIGSQWWCLRRQTIEELLSFLKRRPDIIRFFKTTWIPDETFFQTLVRHLVPRTQINCRTLTFLMFTDYGMPVTFYNDHYNLLLGQDSLFARKISPEAQHLKRKLAELYASDQMEFPITGEGRSLFKFLTGQGRVGRRFGSRFWEREAKLGAKRELFIIVAKKWHVAKRLTDSIANHTAIPVVEYIFNEEEAKSPNLGGSEATIEKRMRHRRAFIKCIFDHFQSNKLVICLDPSSIDYIQDLASSDSTTKVLEVKSIFSDDYLIGHAKRLGMISEQTPKSVIESLLPTLRYDLEFESDRLDIDKTVPVLRLTETDSDARKAKVLKNFFDLDDEAAENLALTPYLFHD